MNRESGVTFAVGDIHGRADLLARLQDRMSASASVLNSGPPRVVYLGDYIDRGEQSREVVDLLIDGLPHFERIYLKGNHEEMFDSMIGHRVNEAIAGSWARNGGQATMRSYGVVVETYEDFCDLFAQIRERLISAMPSRHWNFFDRLDLLHEQANGIFVHAGLNPSRSLANQEAEDIMWIRGPFLSSEKDWGRTVYHGHTPDKFGPFVSKRRVNLDTMAFSSGILTAAVVGSPGSFVCGVMPASAFVVVDPGGDATDGWNAWAEEVVLASGARRAFICSASPLLGQRLSASGIAVSTLSPEMLGDYMADAISPLAESILEGRVGTLFQSEAAKNFLLSLSRFAAPSL